MDKKALAPRFKRTLLFILYLMILLICSAVTAQDEEKVVRVGWFDSAFNVTDKFGRRTGYGYEYQQRIAAYTGWNYEYVTDSWPVLLQKLINGQIDLLSDVSYTDERAEKMLFSSLPMGAESYYLYISTSNTEIIPQDYSSFNGKKIGVNKNSVQKDLFLEWTSAHNVDPVLVELTSSNAETTKMLLNGEIDAFVAIEGHSEEDYCVPVVRIGSSDFYFAVNKDRPDLLQSLNFAMEKVYEEDRYYNMQLSDKYLQLTRTDVYLDAAETSWLSDHGVIRVGYRDNYLPISSYDSTTGELTGALKTYLNLASQSLKNIALEFEAVAYPTTDAALKALTNGEIDCVFPVNLSAYDGEVMNIMMTVPVMDTEMYAVMRSWERIEIVPQQEIIVAVNNGNNNYESFLKDYYPDWKIVYFDNADSSIEAIASNEADCMLISNYRLFQMEDQFLRKKLTSITTGKSMFFSFAVRRSDSQLYSILNKTANLVSRTMIDLALVNYSYSEKKVSLTSFFRDNWSIVLGVMALVFAVILYLLFQRLRVERKANEKQKLINATELDPLTKLYNRTFFFEYAERIHRENPGKPMDAIVLNIDQFHMVNALNGRDFGDSILKLLGSEILRFLENTGGIAGRFESDRFDILCEPQENYQEVFSCFQVRLNEFSKKASIRLRMGVMPWKKDLEPVAMFDRARTACNLARGNYKNRLMIFEEEMRKQELLEQRMVNDLRRAIEEHEFEVYFQPKYGIQGETPKLNSAEALIRWKHPELGLIRPDEFIPLFEKNGQINIVDNYVWDETARHIARWREKYGVTVPVSVNLSRVDVFDPALEPTLDELLSKNGLDRSCFKLEVTESAYVEDAAQVVRVIKRLHEKGFEIEMDDFGSGYSSLNMISSMPIDILKMDRAFIQNIEHSKKDMMLVELILDIAVSLKVPVVAEGVETEGQLKLLKDLGCAMVQGFYFSGPVPPEEFEKIIVRELVH